MTGAQLDSRSGHRRVRLLVVAALAGILGAALLLGGTHLYRHLVAAERDAYGAVTEGGQVGVADLRLGDCLDETFRFNETNYYVDAVPCAEPHRSEIYAITEIAGTGYPDVTTGNDRARAACALHPVPAPTARYFRWFIRPDEKSWNDGNRRVTCVLSAPDDLAGTFSR